MSGRWKVAVAAALFVLVAVAWSWRAPEPGTFTDPKVPRLVRFVILTGDTGVVTLEAWRDLSLKSQPTDSICIGNGRGDTLFNGTYEELRAAAIDTVPITAARPPLPFN